MRKEYIGDSVYVQENIGGFGITLTTENGYGPSNMIVMEPSVIKNLLLTIENWRKEPEAEVEP